MVSKCLSNRHPLSKSIVCLGVHLIVPLEQFSSRLFLCAVLTVGTRVNQSPESKLLCNHLRDKNQQRSKRVCSSGPHSLLLEHISLYMASENARVASKTGYLLVNDKIIPDDRSVVVAPKKPREKKRERKANRSASSKKRKLS